MQFKFEIGQRVRDTITKYEGTITARVEYYTGDLGYRIETLGTDGSCLTEWLDERRVVAINAA